MFPSVSSIEIQNPKLFDEKSISESDFLVPEEASRQSPFNERLQWVKENYAKAQMCSMRVELDSTTSSRVPIGSIVSAVEAQNWSKFFQNCDIRPRLEDKSTGAFRLIDSGSQITATQKLPEDKLDPTIKLVAVNGSRINTYGIRNLDIKIGRKNYSIPAVICDIDQDILGMDFLSF